MKVWRISNHADLSGKGGLLADARWHHKGNAVVYCADHPATALLEKLVHLDLEDIPTAYRLLTIDLPDDAPSHRVETIDLPTGWRGDMQATQTVGTRLLQSARHLVVWVPCALVPYAWNALLNPDHGDIARCSISGVIEELLDPRLIH